MLLNLFTKKPFSPKKSTSSSHEILNTLEEKGVSENKAQNINNRQKKRQGKKFFCDCKLYLQEPCLKNSNKMDCFSMPGGIIYKN